MRLKRPFFFLFICLFVVFNLLMYIIIFSDTSKCLLKPDNNEISVSEYRYFLYNLKFDYEKLFNIENETEDDKKFFWKSYFPGQKVKAENFLKERALELAIDYKVQFILSKDIKLTDDEISDFNEKKKDVFGSEKFKHVSKNIKMDKSDFENIEFNIFLIKKYREFEKSKLSVDDFDLKKYYENNKGDFDKVELKQVYFKTDNDVGKNKKRYVFDRVNEVYNLASMGTEFDQLSKDSDDFIKEEENGIVTLYRNDNNSLKNLIEWSFKEKPGSIGKIKTELGYHICKIEGIYDDFGSLKEDVKEDYMNRIYIQKIRKQRKMEDYEIDVNENLLTNIKLY